MQIVYVILILFKDTSMGTLIIKRKAELANRFRDYKVYINGQKAGTIANGNTEEYALPPGAHTVYCKIDWCTSNAVEVSGDTDHIKILQVCGFKHAAWIMPVAVAASFAGIVLKLLGYVNRFLLVILIPAFIIMLFYLTIGRRNYLTLLEK